MLVQIRRSKSLTSTKTNLRCQLLCLLIILVGCGAPQAEMDTSAPDPAERETVSANDAAQEVMLESANTQAAVEVAEESVETDMMAEESFGAESLDSAFGDDTFEDQAAREAFTEAEARATRARRPPSTADRAGARPRSAAASHSWNAAPRPAAAPQATPQVDDVAAASPPDQPTEAAAETVAPAKKLPVEVEVFYATDRQRVAAIASGDLWKVIRWSLQLGILALLTGIIGTLYQRQGIKIIAAAAAVGCLVLGYGGWIEWQQRTRLKDNGNAWYTHDIKILPMNSSVASASLDEEQTSLDYGRCLVSIPPNHRTGTVEAPSITRFELSEDRDRHVVLESINRSPSSEFFDDLNDRLATGSDEALIFIHGYNVSFNDAVKRTAQISHDVKFQGAPICYSWPSRGGLEDYTRDMANADWSVIHLQEFLASLFERSEARKIHLIAHSMGNRVLMQALDRLALQNQQQTRFGQIVLAAPDVSANDFRQRYSHVIRNMADHVTLYASSRDRALMVSAGVHGHDRAGLAGGEIVIVDGIDTIDVSHVDTSLIGHSYYGDNPELIDDLAAIILQARPTSSRKWLERIDTAANRVYWKFR